MNMNIKALSGWLILVLAVASAAAQQKKWHPAIAEALQHDDPTPLRNLIGSGFIIDTQDETSGETVLIMAAAQGKLNVIKLLVNEGANVDLQDKNGSTALHRAATENIEALKLLLSAKPNLKLVTKQGLSAAETAALFGKRDALNQFIAAGAIYESDLVFASALGDVAAIKEHIAKGADVNRTNKSGLVPLVAAARTGKIEAVQELLGKGANPDGVGSTTPLIMAVGWHQAQVAATLLDSHANPNLADGDGLTPLVNAIHVRDSQEVALLLEKGATVSPVGTTYSPIHEAARADDLKILKALVKQGADINALFYSGGFTPLMIAASENKPRATQFLLTQGARVGLKGKVTMDELDAFYKPTGRKLERQMTALQMAENNRFETIVEIFQNPEGFKLADLERDYTNSKDVSVADWQKKYGEFDPQRGRIATVVAFKKTFGEPSKVVDLDEASFWYYQCADGLIEIKLVNPKVAGAQLVILGLSTVAEPKSTVVPRKEGAASPLRGEPSVATANVPSTSQTPVPSSEPQVEPQERSGTKQDSPNTQGQQQAPVGAATSRKEKSRSTNTSFANQNGVDFLAEASKDESAADQIVKNNMLRNAALLGEVEKAARYLKDGADINTNYPGGNTPLMFAAQRGHLEMVKFLIGKGADPTKTNRFGKMAIDLAKDPDVIAVLKSAATKK